MFELKNNFIPLDHFDPRIDGFICLREGIDTFPEAQDADEPDTDLLDPPDAGASFQSWVDYFNQNTGYYLTQLNGIQFYLTRDYNDFRLANSQLELESLNDQFNQDHLSEIAEFKEKFKLLSQVLFDRNRSPHKTMFWPLWTLPDSPVGYRFIRKDPHNNQREFEITARFFPDHAADLVVNYSLIIISQHEDGGQYQP